MYKISNNLFPTYKVFIFSLIIIQASCQQNMSGNDGNLKGNTYYIGSSGDDKNNGSGAHPWKTIQQLNSIQLKAGDSVLFQGGQTFSGSILIDSNESGTKDNPIVFTSSGNSNAIINAGNEAAFTVNRSGFITIQRLNFIGAGRKDGNTKDGVAIINSNNILINNLDIKGFQKAGLFIYSSSNSQVNNVYAHENGFAGISVSGANAKTDCQDIFISNCTAENNPGDPTILDNHSGNGIIAGFCKRVTIDKCVATNNGWDMPRVGNGPVGIWCFEADSVIIQQCISYRNKTAVGAADGGGYDFDGGVTNSIIQYCLSYENQGSAFGIFQYSGASKWYNNTIRFNISENDGNVSPAHAGIFVWNSTRDEKQFKDLYFYNNIIYNPAGAAISYANESENAGFHFYNNIFVAKNQLITGIESTGIFLGNDWWNLSGGFNIDGIKNITAWAQQKGKEQLNNKFLAVNQDPLFVNPGKTVLTDPSLLKSFASYHLPASSVLRKSGLDLRALFGIDIGNLDFNQQPVLPGGIGASF